MAALHSEEISGPEEFGCELATGVGAGSEGGVTIGLAAEAEEPGCELATGVGAGSEGGVTIGASGLAVGAFHVLEVVGGQLSSIRRPSKARLRCR